MRALLTVLFVVMAVPVSAQTGTPTNWILQLYVAGGAAVGTGTSVSAPAVQCGQTRVAGDTQNPTMWKWADPADSTKDCVFNDAARLAALPDGNYEGTVRAVNSDGMSAESARAPFTRRRPNPPAVPTDLRITQ